MSIYDIIGEISEKQATKTETGDARIYGVVVGIVAKNYDKDMPGRVCVTIPTRDSSKNELQWARQALPSSGSDWGYYFVPEVGDQVLLAFEGGNIEKPYVIGCLPKENSKLVSKTVDAQNQYKRIMTKNGSSITFEDNKEGSGEKDKITVETAGSAHTVLHDNENKLIRISDKKKENMVELKTEAGEMTVKCKSRLTVQVGDSIKITLNGESGSVSVSAKEFSVKTSGSVQLKTDSMLKLEGAQFNAKASSGFKVESSGMVNVSGSTIKLG